MKPEENKFHKGNGEDGKHYWLTPPELYKELTDEFCFNYDPCPFPKPDDYDGLTSEWSTSNYVNPPFGSIIGKDGKKKGPTAWARKCIEEKKKGNKSVMVFPLDKWVLMMIEHCSEIRNLGDVKWLATEDGKTGKGLGRHIACFVLDPNRKTRKELEQEIQKLKADREVLVYLAKMCRTILSEDEAEMIEDVARQALKSIGEIE